MRTACPLFLLLAACFVSQEEICDLDGDGFLAVECGGDDCDDSDPTVHPGATEYCDGRDNNCDGVVDGPDAVDAQTWWVDADLDGFGDAEATTVACYLGEGLSDNDLDCDDTDPTIHPGADEVPYDGIDQDCDGYDLVDVDGDLYPGVDKASYLASFPDSPWPEWVLDELDCDDEDPTVHPGATERCDGKDNNCDGVVDGPDSVDVTTWYLDHDGDGWGDDDVAEVACYAPDGFVAVGGDCDDTRDDVYPGAPEVCDGVDNNCNGLVDDDDPAVIGQVTWFRDADDDGFGDPEEPLDACFQPEGYVDNDLDCDDDDPYTFPGAPEHCNGKDNSCSGIVDGPDPVDAPTWYFDGDSDGWGRDDMTVEACSPPPGYVAVGGDCDDTDPLVHPGADPICNDGIDNNCDGTDSGCSWRGEVSLTEADAVLSGRSSPVAWGDLNGDGYPDAVVRGANGWTPDGMIMYPNMRLLVLSGADLAAGSSNPAVLATIRYTASTTSGLGTWGGVAVCDITGDGQQDLVVQRVPPEGDVAYWHAFIFTAPSGTRELDSYDAARGGWGDGESLACGDVTGNGQADLVVGIPAFDENRGTVAVHAGPITVPTSLPGPYGREGASTNARFGEVVALADLNGDGRQDILVGAPGEGSGRGYVHAYFDGGSFTWFGQSAGDAAGSSISAGDLDGNGIPDLVIGAPGRSSGAGEAYVIFDAITWDATPRSLSWADAVFVGASGDGAGAVHVAHDMDKDGHDDLVVGAEGSGRLFLFYGGAFSGSYLLEDADATFTGAAGRLRFASDADLVGDGHHDLLVGSTNGAWLLRGWGL